MNDPVNETLFPPAPAPKRGLPTGLIVGLGVVGFCVLLFAFFMIDPFRWNVAGNIKMLLGLDGDPVAAAMPASTSMYFGIDLLNAQPAKLDRIFKPFAQAAASTTPDTNTAIQDLDKDLKEAAGITLSDDIMPWIGKSAGFGIQDLQMGPKNTLQKFEAVFAVQSRDNAKADAFLKKIKDSAEAKGTQKFTETAYAGVTIYAMKAATGGSVPDGVAFTRSGDVVLFSFTDTALHAAIDAQKGASLAKDKTYQDLIAKLPKDRLATMYMPTQKFADMYLAMIQANPALFSTVTEEMQQLFKEQFQKISAEAAGLSLTDAGMQMDLVATYVPDKLTSSEKKALELIKTPLKTVALLPEDTLMFAAGQGFVEPWETTRERFLKVGGMNADEYTQAMSQFEKQFKFNPDKDLFPYLSGEFMLAMMPSSQGALQQANVNLGLLVTAELSDSAKVSGALDKLAAAMPALIGAPLNRQEAAGLTYYNYKMAQSEVFAFGNNNSYLLIGTSGNILENLFAKKSSLANSPRYQAATKLLPTGMQPAFYLDLEGTLANIRETMPKTSLDSFNKSIQSLKPLTHMVAGATMLDASTMKATLVIAIAPAK